MVNSVGMPKIGMAGDTPPAPFRTISMVPEIIPAKQPSVKNKITNPKIRIGFVKLIGANSTGAMGKARFAPQRLQ